ncbi:MAG TPA: thioredoxin family protein [Saprospiraceae bacterium]|nr:thioredoxin family protein [Saprospiraceae bacterium]
MNYIFVACICLIVNWACAPRTYTPIVVRPASCSNIVQFAQSPNLGYLLEFAHKMHKPVFIDFYTPWVESCTRMDQLVFTQDAVAHYFNEHFINYKVNVGGASEESHLADMYGVTIFPTLVFVDGKGKIMLRHEGPVTAAQLLEMGSYLHESIADEEFSLGTR